VLGAAHIYDGTRGIGVASREARYGQSIILVMTSDMSSHIPPPGEPVAFTRNDKTGRVHIMRWSPRPARVPFAAIVLSTHIRVLCGVGLWDAPYVAGDGFTDDELCFGCLRVLGDQRGRAFHADSRGY
jgi:hypothetical protein